MLKNLDFFNIRYNIYKNSKDIENDPYVKVNFNDYECKALNSKILTMTPEVENLLAVDSQNVINRETGNKIYNPELEDTDDNGYKNILEVKTDSLVATLFYDKTNKALFTDFSKDLVDPTIYNGKTVSRNLLELPNDINIYNLLTHQDSYQASNNIVDNISGLTKLNSGIRTKEVSEPIRPNTFTLLTVKLRNIYSLPSKLKIKYENYDLYKEASLIKLVKVKVSDLGLTEKDLIVYHLLYSTSGKLNIVYVRDVKPEYIYFPLV